MHTLCDCLRMYLSICVLFVISTKRPFSLHRHSRAIPGPDRENRKVLDLLDLPHHSTETHTASIWPAAPTTSPQQFAPLTCTSGRNPPVPEPWPALSGGRVCTLRTIFPNAVDFVWGTRAQLAHSHIAYRILDLFWMLFCVYVCAR